jgi:8-oxo-dGTP pyrophosphatase MutT (NUDIX family)
VLVVTEPHRGQDIASVRAAGGVVWRMDDRAPEVLLVHRPKYDDWTFPKGKLDPGETYEQAALREVHEETGLECVLGHELAGVEYRDAKGRPKTVRYWEMSIVAGAFAPNAEVDEIRWLTLVDAAALLTYRHDGEVLRSFARFAGR